MSTRKKQRQFSPEEAATILAEKLGFDPHLTVYFWSSVGVNLIEVPYPAQQTREGSEP